MAVLCDGCCFPYDQAMSVRIEQFDGGEVLYVALDPDGVWARSEFPDELLTIDYNAQGSLIGIEIIGSLARRGAQAIVRAIVDAKEVASTDAVRKALESLAA
jgi:uncharacterized protein YuzE